MTVQNEGGVRQAGNLLAEVGQIVLQELLDPSVRGAAVVRQQAVLLPVGAQQILGGLEKIGGLSVHPGGLSGRGEFQVDIKVQFLLFFFGAGTWLTQAQGAVEIHDLCLPPVMAQILRSHYLQLVNEPVRLPEVSCRFKGMRLFHSLLVAW